MRNPKFTKFTMWRRSYGALIEWATKGDLARSKMATRRHKVDDESRRYACPLWLTGITNSY